jgi:hypothetical protein
MVKDEQVRILMRQIKEGSTFELSAAKAGMGQSTARRYRKTGQLPSQSAAPHTWRTRSDPFLEADWQWTWEQLKISPALDPITLFEALQRMYPGRYQDGQLRTFERRIKVWRASEGPSKEVFFPQIYYPGQWSESDFTRMNSLGITIAGQPFDHMLYHFVLCYSNWEAGTVCFSECYESLAGGLQNALWELGGVPKYHRTDQLTAAVKVANPDEFTQRYKALESRYGFISSKTQAHSPNENGDIEQRNFRFKKAVEQALLLRGSKDFADRREYDLFLKAMFDRLNAGRTERLKEELATLRELPACRLEDYRRERVKVGHSSSVRILHNTYSVHSRLVGETVEARVYADHVEIWYAQRKVEHMPRLRGENKHRIDYRHIIDQLVRKPGAFENYRYRDDLFPTSLFRVAYDSLSRNHSQKFAAKEYLRILYLAARENEAGVNDAMRGLITQGLAITAIAVEKALRIGQAVSAPTDVTIDAVNIAEYDGLFATQEVLV